MWLLGVLVDLPKLCRIHFRLVHILAKLEPGVLIKDPQVLLPADAAFGSGPVAVSAFWAWVAMVGAVWAWLGRRE